ncbi:MAG: hypothetical protein PHO53_06645 [Actinomycetota bacterium]|nr:hypothetical protein [Actinomycetota bacterium]
MKEKKRHLIRLTVVCATLVALALFGGGSGSGEVTSHEQLDQKPADLPAEPIIPPEIEVQVLNGPCNGDDEYLRLPSEKVKVKPADPSLFGCVTLPPPPPPKVSLEEAEKYIGAKLRVPKETLGGKLTGIQIDTSASCNKIAYFEYDNSIAMSAEVWKEKPDFRLQAASYAAVAENPNVGCIGAVPHVVEVAGFEMLAYPPHYFGYRNDKGEIDEVWSLPPGLGWWDSGIKYGACSGKLGFTEKQLIKIAESMYI